MFETKNDAQMQRDVIKAVWTRVGRSTVGFVNVRGDSPASLGSGTLMRFGNIVGIVTCAHVLDALLKEAEIGIFCSPVRATQIQTLRLAMATTDSVAIGAPPWGEPGPDLAFLRLPTSMIGDIERAATIANGDVHRQNIIAGRPAPARELCALAGVVDELTEPFITSQVADNRAATTAFSMLINIGNAISDDDSADRIRFQPISSEGAILPKSYKGTSGGGLWHLFLGRDDLSVVQVRLVGVAYWEKHVGDELHIIAHGQISIYDTLFKAICQKWLDA